MLISVVVPTYGRPERMARLYHAFTSQTYKNSELVVLDDSDAPSELFRSLDDPRVRYVHQRPRSTTGAKRNKLLELARGEGIVQFDDDDFYTSGYVANAAEQLREVDFFTLASAYIFRESDRSFYYWDFTRLTNAHFVVNGHVKSEPPVVNPLARCHPARRQEVLDSHVFGYGFSYAYRKSATAGIAFPDKVFGEDYQFACALRSAGRSCRAVPDEKGLCVHFMQPKSTSRVFPQYRLPNHLLSVLFGKEFAAYERAGR